MAPRSSDSRPILCAVLDARALGPRPGETASLLFESGVDWIQLRDRTIGGGDLWHVACALVAARDARNAGRVIVNRRLDVALAVGADGVHLGFDAVDPAAAHALLPNDAWIGSSVHSIDEIRARADSPDSSAHRYAHLAPIWDPISKTAERHALGPSRLAEACRWGLPILAQGGVDPERAAEAIRAGAAGVAVTGSLAHAEGREDAARRLRAALDGQNPPRG